MNWYYVEDGKRAGPVDELQVVELREAGRITSDTLVWHEGMPNWTAFSKVEGELKPTFKLKFEEGGSRSGTKSGPVPEAVCTECNRIYPTSSMIRYGEAHVCANCKPTFLQKLSEGARMNFGALVYAGFWIRWLAKILDNIIITIVLGA